MKYGLIVYFDTVNFGDDIQTYATEQFLPHVDYLVDREGMDAFYTERGEVISTLLSGWYLHNHLSWPPSPFLDVLPISMHFDTYYSLFAGEKLTKNFVLEDYGKEWLLDKAPIGCRDDYTKNLLDKYGIPAYFSGCITLTLMPFGNIKKRDTICLVDVSESVKNFFYRQADCKVEEYTHISKKLTDVPWSERRVAVEKRLKQYQGAGLVVTGRLHAALPCLALHTPVLFVDDPEYYNRTSTWLPYLHHAKEDDIVSGHYDFRKITDNPGRFQLVAERLRDCCTEYIQICEGKKEKHYDLELFKESRKRIERLKKLFVLRTDKLMRLKTGI